MTEIVVLIGNLGAGKNTLVTAVSMLMAEEFPEVPQIANTPIIPYAHHVADANKFLAIKLSARNKQYALVIEDEVAQSGLEARGSGSSKGQAIESRVISLARKAKVDLLLITQMLSMVDKRVQWLGTIYILCEVVYLVGNFTDKPDLFSYTIYDNNMKEIEGAGFELYFDECERYVFPHMDTDDIPSFGSLKQQWEKWFDIEAEDYIENKAIMAKETYERKTPVPITKTFMTWVSKKSLQVGASVKLEKKDWEIGGKKWDADNKEWEYELEKAM